VAAAAGDEQLMAEVRACFEEEADFLAEFLAARSPTGEEGPAAPLMARWLVANGFETETRPVRPEQRAKFPALESEADLDGRPNVYGWWRSSHPERSPLVLNGHFDVVPADESEWSRPPYAATRAEGRIWGRGSTDMKGGVVTAMFAARALMRSGLAPERDVQIQGVMGEETGGLGTLAALDNQPRPAAAIVLEPTENVVVPACGGILQFRVRVAGRAAHTAVPWHGVDATRKLWLVGEAIREFSAEQNAAIDHPLFAHLPQAAPTGFGIFGGGEYHSTLPAQAMLAGRVGVMPGDYLQDLKDGLLAAVAASGEGDEWLAEHPPELEWIHEGFAGWETPVDHPLVEEMVAGCEAATGDRRVAAVTYGSDAGHFAAAGVPVALFGPGSIIDAHQVDESLAEENLLEATGILALGLRRLLDHGSHLATTTPDPKEQIR
jgi:acetylornithine deacetylase